MSCDGHRDELVAFHFGTLEDPARDALEVHLAQCPVCLADFLSTKRAIELADVDPAPSEASRARLRSAVAQILRARQRRAWSWWERSLAVGVAAASLLLALGVTQAVARSDGAPPHNAAQP